MFTSWIQSQSQPMSAAFIGQPGSEVTFCGSVLELHRMVLTIFPAVFLRQNVKLVMVLFQVLVTPPFDLLSMQSLNLIEVQGLVVSLHQHFFPSLCKYFCVHSHPSVVMPSIHVSCRETLLLHSLIIFLSLKINYYYYYYTPFFIFFITKN